MSRFIKSTSAYLENPDNTCEIVKEGFLKESVLLSNRIPKEFFITKGVGESDITVHAGSYHLALRKAGIEMCNIMVYSSILPKVATEINKPVKLTHGSVMECIMATANTTKGIRATASVMYGILYDKKTNAKYGGLVCEYDGSKNEIDAEYELRESLNELYVNGYSDDYDLRDIRTITESFIPKKNFGTAIVALCFTNYLLSNNKMNYGNLPNKYSNLKDSDIVIVPVPYDETSTWIKGSDKGPKAIFEASRHLELYDIETATEVYKKGIFTDDAIDVDVSPEKMVGAVTNKISELIQQGKFSVLVGGEHSVAIGSIKAHSKLYSNMCVLQLDAHADLRDTYEKSKFNHACVMARAKEYCPIVQVGIRSMDSSEIPCIDNNKIFYAKDIYNSETWMEDAIAQLDGFVYISIDLDVFDPSIMPSTGTPEPGGLDWYMVMKFLRKVSQERNIVGFDIVEFCPNKNNKAPDFLAAKLIYTLLSYIFSERHKKWVQY